MVTNILPAFPFDAAKRRAENSGLVVISVCHADLLPGTPRQDGTGNYIQARTVYIGRPGSMEHSCAYARCYSTIYQRVDPGLAECLSAITYHLLVFNEFNGSRASYEDYMNDPYRLYPQDQLRAAWHEHATTAQRAMRCLPPELLAWLQSLNAAKC